MKSIALLFMLVVGNLLAEERQLVQKIQVFDVKNEALSGVKVQLEGTSYVFYTNINGECYIPMNVIKASRSIVLESISYKSKSLTKTDIPSKIVMDFR